MPCKLKLYSIMVFRFSISWWRYL